MSYLIDSDWLIEYLAGQNAAIELFESLAPSPIAISIITYAEVYDGILNGRSRQPYESGFEQFLVAATVHEITMPIAKVWAAIRGDLRRRGRLIPASDLFIASTAIHHDLTLVTRNLRHFERVPGLRLLESSVSD